MKSTFIPNHVQMPTGFTPPVEQKISRPELITVHGNITYDFYYRSKIDTPFNQGNLQQHMERVWLDVVIKEKYPFKIGFTARESNSPFFKDLFNSNINFDKYSFNKTLRQSLLNKITEAKWQNPELKMIDTALKKKLVNYRALKNWIDGPEALQRIIEEREKASSLANEKPPQKDEAFEMPDYHNLKLNNRKFLSIPKDTFFNKVSDSPLPASDSLFSRPSLNTSNDSKPLMHDSVFTSTGRRVQMKTDNLALKTDSSFSQTFKKKMAELDTLEKSIAQLQRQCDSLKNCISKTILKVRQDIYKAAGKKELNKIAGDNGVSGPRKDKLANFFSHVESLSVGRSMIDYTELTAQNVMVTGVNIEYNPSYYAAFAAGKIDYGFRDFFGRAIKQKSQYLLLERFGWGYKDKRSIIVTLFNGRKNDYPGLLIADSTNHTSPLFGYSIETAVKKNDRTSLSLEIAKSTKNTTYPSSQAAINKAENLFKFNDNSNMGLNIKAKTEIPETGTKLSGFYRKTGEKFQSFSLFTFNTNQEAWQLRADQALLKGKAYLTAMLRENDFTNPLTYKTFKTSTVFKSFQVNVKVPHWPIINAGYFPGSQFFIVDKNTVEENAYYILNGSVLYPYRLKGIVMNTSFIYNRYINHATDSGFVLYKGVNYIFSQELLFKKLQFEGSYSYNKQSGLNYYTLDVNGDYNISDLFRIGGGAKYNQVLSGENYWGESIRLSANFKKLGGLQLHYEKSYLPTIRQTLYPVEIGRLSWYKTF